MKTPMRPTESQQVNNSKPGAGALPLHTQLPHLGVLQAALCTCPDASPPRLKPAHALLDAVTKNDSAPCAHALHMRTQLPLIGVLLAALCTCPPPPPRASPCPLRCRITTNNTCSHNPHFSLADAPPPSLVADAPVSPPPPPTHTTARTDNQKKICAVKVGRL